MKCINEVLIQCGHTDSKRDVNLLARQLLVLAPYGCCIVQFDAAHCWGLLCKVLWLRKVLAYINGQI